MSHIYCCKFGFYSDLSLWLYSDRISIWPAVVQFLISLQCIEEQRLNVMNEEMLSRDKDDK